MDTVLKRRLVGAAVIIALAVIFVPMLLESPQSGGPVKSEIKIPQKPSYNIPNRLESKVVDDIQRESSTIPTPEKPVIAADSPLINQFPSTKSDATTPTQPASAVQTEPVAKQPAKIVVETSTMPAPPVKKTKKNTAKKVPPASASTASGFVAQVGSFSQKQNAVVLADKLQASGYASFVEEVKADNGMVYRVKIGPVNARSEAESLLNNVKANEGLGGIVVAYP